MAAKRAIAIGIALGATATAIKIILASNEPIWVMIER